MYGMKNYKLIEAICELYKEGNSIKEVAEASGVSKATVGRIIKERGLSRPKGSKCRTGFSTADCESSNVTGMLERECPACGCRKHLLNAKFCCECGASLATPKDRAKEAAERVLDYFRPYRSGTVKNMDGILRDVDTVIDYVNAEG